MTGLQDAGVEQLYDGEADRGAEIQRLNGVRDNVMSPTLRDSVMSPTLRDNAMSPTLRDNVMSPTPTLIHFGARWLDDTDGVRRPPSKGGQHTQPVFSRFGRKLPHIYADVRTFR